MNIIDIYQLFLHHQQVTTDSRNCPKDSMFFALKGERFDGNKFAEKALEAGCAYAIIDDPTYYKDERTIVVDNVLTTLQQLAHHHRKALGLPIIGITGTNGKTTTKELVAAVLSTKYNVLYTEGNLNNQIGVPLSVNRIRSITRRHGSITLVEMCRWQASPLIWRRSLRLEFQAYSFFMGSLAGNGRRWIHKLLVLAHCGRVLCGIRRRSAVGWTCA